MRHRVLSALALVTLACQDAPGDGTADRGPAPERALVEVRRLAASDTGATAFGRIVDVALGRDGRVFVADAQAAEVRVFDREGAQVASWGRAGEGPGEFGYLSGIALDPAGTLWVMDALNQRLTGFSPDGDTVTVRGLQEGWSATIPWLGRFATDGALLDLVIERVGDTTHQILERASVGDGRLERQARLSLPPFAPPRYERQRGGVRELATLPFAPERKLAIAPDGTIWMNAEAAYVVHRIGPGGDTLATVRTDDPPPRLTDAQRDSASRASGVALSRIPEQRPWIDRLVVDAGGRLWVMTSDRPDRWDRWSAAGERETVAVSAEYDVGGVTPVIVGDTVVGLVVDELGRQSVVVSELRRPPP